MSPRADVSMSADEVRTFLEPPRTAVLSTLGPDGFPHSVGMWFVPVFDTTMGELRMWAYAKSQKIRNLERDNRCAAMVEEGDAYDTLRGILVRGLVELVEDFDHICAIGAALYERYTLPRTGIPVNEGPHIEIERQAAKRKGLVLPLLRVTSWDHRKLVTGGSR